MTRMSVSDSEFAALIDWTRSTILGAGKRGALVALSGGVDSSVTAGLTVRAVGASNVLGIGIPIHSDPSALTDAHRVADFLGIEFKELDLTAAFDAYVERLSPQARACTLTMGNTRARFRMVAQYAEAAVRNLLVAGTCNRSELAIGYFTKYGDGGIDFEPNARFYKAEVRDIGRKLGLPEDLVMRVPTADLWEGQTDEGELGLSYDVLDAVLYAMDHGRSLDAFDPAHVARIRAMRAAATHKLKLPPVFERVTLDYAA